MAVQDGHGKMTTSGLVFAYDIKDQVNSYLGEPTQNLALDSLSQGGWPGTHTLIDSATKTFDFTTSSVEWGGTAAWTMFYYDVSAYTGQYVTISAVIDEIDESNGLFSFIMIGQTINNETYLGYSPEADRNSTTTRNRERISWSGIIGSGGKVGILIWLENSARGVSGSVRVRFTNVQVELKSHPTAFVGRGRENLIQNTNVTTWGKQAGVTAESTMQRGALGNENVYKINFGSYNGGDAIGTSITGTIGEMYTFSGWVKADSATSGYITIGRANSNPSVQKAMSITTSWQYFEVSYVLNTNTTLYHNFAGVNTSYYVSDLKINSASRTATSSLFDLTGGVSTINLNSVSFDANSAIQFDGTNDLINIGSHAASQFGPSTSAFSVEFVYKVPASPTKTTAGSVISRYRYNFQHVYSGNYVQFDYVNKGYDDNGSYSATAITAGLNPAGQWNHIVFTYTRSGDSASLAAYRSGVLVNTGSSTRLSTYPLSNFYIGHSDHLGGTYYDLEGTIGAIRIYNRALTQAEVLQNYKTVRTKYGIS